MGVIIFCLPDFQQHFSVLGHDRVYAGNRPVLPSFQVALSLGGGVSGLSPMEQQLHFVLILLLKYPKK